LVEDVRYRIGYTLAMRELKQDPVGYYKRALKRRQSQVRWLNKKIMELEAEKRG